MADLGNTALSIAGQTNVGKSIISTGSSIASGAALGSVVPGVGTLVGGLIGGIGDFFSSLFGGGGPTLQEREAKELGRVNALPKPLQDKYYSNKESVWAHQKEYEASYREYLWGHKNDPNFKADPYTPYQDPNGSTDYIDVLEKEAGTPASGSNTGATIPGQENALNSLFKIGTALLASGLGSQRQPANTVTNGGELPMNQDELIKGNGLGPTSNFNSGSQIVSVKSPYALLVIGAVVVGGIYFYKKGK